MVLNLHATVQLALGATVQVELSDSRCKLQPTGRPPQARLGAGRHKQSMHGHRPPRKKQPCPLDPARALTPLNRELWIRHPQTS